MRAWVAFVCSLWVLFTAQPGTAEERTRQSIVPGDVIIAFKPHTDGNQRLRQATERDADPKEVLGPTVRDLSDRTGVPLTVKQPLSGHRLLLAIDCGGLLEKLAIELRNEQTFTQVHLRPLPTGACSRAGSPPALVLELAGGSDESTTLEQNMDTVSRALTSRFDRRLALPHRVRMEDRVSAVVEIDMTALTLLVVDRLQAHPDLESARPNYLMTIR